MPQSINEEALLSSKIEGELLNRDSLQSSIRRLFGLAHDGRKASPTFSLRQRVKVEITGLFPVVDPVGGHR